MALDLANDSNEVKHPLHRKLRPDGIGVNIMEAPCDSDMYFLLGCMQATGQISGKHLNIAKLF